MSRILDIPEASRTTEQSRLHGQVTSARGMFFSPYKVWIYNPPVGFGMEMIGTHLNSSGCSLSAAEMELAALITAWHWNAAYVIKNHSRHAIRAGLPESVVKALEDRRVPQLADERLKAVHDFASASLRGETPSDEDFAHYVAVISRAGIADILAVIGYFTSVSLAMKTHGV